MTCKRAALPALILAAGLALAPSAAFAAPTLKLEFSNTGGGAHLLAYVQKEGGRYFVVGFHLKDAKCDGHGVRVYLVPDDVDPPIRGQKKWDNDLGCGKDRWVGGLHFPLLSARLCETWNRGWSEGACTRRSASDAR